MARFVYAVQASPAANEQMQQRVRQVMLYARGIRCEPETLVKMKTWASDGGHSLSRHRPQIISGNQ